MKTLGMITSALALSTLLTGCVGVGPNTQEGAVTGGTLGAIAGAIIGHNSRGGDTLGGAVLGATAGAIAGGTLGNAQDQRNGTLYTSEPGPRRVVVSGPPPPPSSSPTEYPGRSPDPSAVWIPGYWDYTGAGYVWTPGRWEVPPPMATSYIAAHWETRGNAYVFVRGYWR